MFVVVHSLLFLCTKFIPIQVLCSAEIAFIKISFWPSCKFSPPFLPSLISAAFDTICNPLPLDVLFSLGFCNTVLLFFFTAFYTLIIISSPLLLSVHVLPVFLLPFINLPPILPDFSTWTAMSDVNLNLTQPYQAFFQVYSFFSVIPLLFYLLRHFNLEYFFTVYFFFHFGLTPCLHEVLSLPMV